MENGGEGEKRGAGCGETTHKLLQSSGMKDGERRKEEEWDEGRGALYKSIEIALRACGNGKKEISLQAESGFDRAAGKKTSPKKAK